ncbi:hypothetical protein [Kosakonia sp. YIM B13611]
MDIWHNREVTFTAEFYRVMKPILSLTDKSNAAMYVVVKNHG